MLATCSYFPWFISLVNLWGLSITTVCVIFSCFHHHMFLLSVPKCFVFPYFGFSLFLRFLHIWILCQEKAKVWPSDFLHPWDSDTQFPFHCFWIWWEIFQNSSPFFLQPSSYRSLPAGQPWASALSCLVCWRFRPPAWLALPRLAAGAGASSKCLLPGQLATGLVEQTIAADLQPDSDKRARKLIPCASREEAKN